MEKLQKDDFGQGTAGGAPMHWSKYTAFTLPENRYFWILSTIISNVEIFCYYLVKIRAWRIFYFKTGLGNTHPLKMYVTVSQVLCTVELVKLLFNSKAYEMSPVSPITPMGNKPGLGFNLRMQFNAWQKPNTKFEMLSMIFINIIDICSPMVCIELLNMSIL